MAGNGVGLPPPPDPASGGARREWEVDYSRFFNFPKPSPLATGLLTPLPKGKKRSKGTWLSAATTASIVLARPGSASGPVVSVSVLGIVVEEHFVSSLHFSWPQVSCVPQCPVRGSRAVFLSYRNCSGQVQKFAVRFPTDCAAETFINSVKECLRDAMDIASSGCDMVCENSSTSEFIASNGLPRVDDSSYERPIATRAPNVPALTYNTEQLESPLQPLLATNIDTIFSGLPPSFTELLTNCSADSEKVSEQCAARMESHSTSQIEGELQLQDPSSHNASEVPGLTEEIDIKTEIAKYMSDASFHDMLFKIEKVIDEMGGDLLL